MFNTVKRFASWVSLGLVVSPFTAWAEWRTPAKVAVDLATEIRGGERRAVLLLSAGVGTACDGAASDLKTTAKFDEGSTVIEILGYDFTPDPRRPEDRGACPAYLAEARARVSLPNFWLKPDTESRMTFVLGSMQNVDVIKRNGFRVDLDPLKATTVLAGQFPEAVAGPSSAVKTVVWPANVGRLYLAGSVESGWDYHVALRAFAKANKMMPADEIHKTLKDDGPTHIWVQVPDGTVPPQSRSRRIGRLPNHRGVEVYLTAPFDIQRSNVRAVGTWP